MASRRARPRFLKGGPGSVKDRRILPMRESWLATTRLSWRVRRCQRSASTAGVMSWSLPLPRAGMPTP